MNITFVLYYMSKVLVPKSGCHSGDSFILCEALLDTFFSYNEVIMTVGCWSL